MSTAATRTVAWFHPFNGIAGDMALGALLDAGADLLEVRKTLDGLHLAGWSVDVEMVQRNGLRATRAIVETNDQTAHRHYSAIVTMLRKAELTERVRHRALGVFARLAEVEGALHGVPPADVEFHEVGSIDAIVDIVGVCAALESLGVDDVFSGPVAIGHGTVNAAHGDLPNPAPAVAQLLIGAPVVGVDVAGELTTPTGAALLAELVTAWGPVPSMRVQTAGLGAGTWDPPGRANVTQVMIGVVETAADASENLLVLETNVDDASGEVLGEVVRRLMAAGALDAWLTPVIMKKGRPAFTVHALVTADLEAPIRSVLVDESGTLGVRATPVNRWTAPRITESVELDGHSIAIKVSAHRGKAEFDDAAAVAKATGQPVREVIARAEAAWNATRDKDSPRRPEH